MTATFNLIKFGNKFQLEIFGRESNLGQLRQDASFVQCRPLPQIKVFSLLAFYKDWGD